MSVCGINNHHIHSRLHQFVDSFFLAASQPDPPDKLMLLDFAGGDARPLGELPFRFARWGTMRVVTASRDGRWVLTSHVDQWERDIFVLDHFR